jgi:hypothetical protein
MGNVTIDKLPGVFSANGWEIPDGLSQAKWIDACRSLTTVEGAVQWWRGDWWAYGLKREYGKGKELAEEAGVNYGTIRNYGAVSRAFELSVRTDNLSFDHYVRVLAVPEPERQEWLDRAVREDWSSNQLRAAIKQGAAYQRTRDVEFDAKELGKYAVLYADPPWQYENAPMGGDNRAIGSPAGQSDAAGDQAG